MSARMKVVDPHVHLWDLASGLYPGLETPSTGFIGDNSPIARTYLRGDLLADAGEVEVIKAVHVEAFPTDPVKETAHVQAMADAAPDGLPQGIIANADLSAPNLEEVLEGHAGSPNFRGIRQVLNTHADPVYAYVETDHMADPAWRDGFTLLKQFDAIFDLQIYPHQMHAAAELARANPDVRIVLNHAGMIVDRTLAGWRQWRDGLRELAAADNVAVKISGLGMFDRDWSVESIRPYVLETIDAFGTDRAMFASNFPVDKLFSSYAAIWSAFDAITRGCSDDERSGLFRTNAERIYRI